MSVDPVIALVETKLLPVILPVADIVALDTAPDAVNELPEIAPVVVSVVPVIALKLNYYPLYYQLRILSHSILPLMRLMNFQKLLLLL